MISGKKPLLSRLRALLEPPKRPQTRNSPSRPTTPKQRFPSPLQSAFAYQLLHQPFPHFRLPSSAQEPKNKAGFSKIDMKRILSLLAAGWRMLCGAGMANGQESEEVRLFKAVKIKAEQGHAKAQAILGLMYRKGQGVEKNDKEPAKWFQKAAEQGDADAQFCLGAMYYNGEGVPQDYAEAVKWFRKAAEQKHAAQAMLGGMYSEGKGVPKDDVKAAEWNRKAAEQGDAMAQHSLGVMYENGEGVPQDHVEAAKWYRKAAEQGLASAQYNLGVMYYNDYNGEVVPKDYKKAAKWIRKAAEQGDAMAQYSLGAVYYFGWGVPKDEVEGYAWFLLAKANGNERASEEISNLEERLTVKQGKKAQARAAELHRLYGKQSER